MRRFPVRVFSGCSALLMVFSPSCGAEKDNAAVVPGGANSESTGNGSNSTVQKASQKSETDSISKSRVSETPKTPVGNSVDVKNPSSGKDTTGSTQPTPGGNPGQGGENTGGQGNTGGNTTVSTSGSAASSNGSQ